MLLASLRLIFVLHNTVELEERWKLFYYGFEPAKCAQAGVSTLVNWQSVRIPLGGRVCMLRLKLLGHSLYLLQVQGVNAIAVQLEFVEEISDALRWVETNDSTIVLGDFSAHVGNDARVWKGVFGRHGDADVNDNWRLLV